MLVEVLQRGEDWRGISGVLILHWELLRLMREGCQGLPVAGGCLEPEDEQPNPSALQQPPLWPLLWTISHGLAPRVGKLGSLRSKGCRQLLGRFREGPPRTGGPELRSPTGYTMVRDKRRAGIRKHPCLSQGLVR